MCAPCSQNWPRPPLWLFLSVIDLNVWALWRPVFCAEVHACVPPFRSGPGRDCCGVRHVRNRRRRDATRGNMPQTIILANCKILTLGIGKRTSKDKPARHVLSAITEHLLCARYTARENPMFNCVIRPLIPRIARGPLSTQRGWAVFGIKPLPCSRITHC